MSGNAKQRRIKLRAALLAATTEAGEDWEEVKRWRRDTAASDRCVYRGAKEALAHAALCSHPGEVRRPSSVRVQSSHRSRMDWVDVLALLHEANVHGEERQRLFAWALGQGDMPVPAYHRFSRAIDRMRASGREDLIARRVVLPQTRRTELPEGAQGLREEPLDERSPLNNEYEAKYIA